MTCSDVRNKLDDYLDQELDAANGREVEAHLVECMDCARTADERRSFSDRVGTALKTGYGEIEAGSARRGDVVEHLIRSVRRRSMWFPAIAAAAAFLLVGGIIAHGLGLFTPAPAETDIDAVARMKEERDIRKKNIDQITDELKTMIKNVGGEIPEAGVASDTAHVETAYIAQRLASINGVKVDYTAASPRKQALQVLKWLNSADPDQLANGWVLHHQLDKATIDFIVESTEHNKLPPVMRVSIGKPGSKQTLRVSKPILVQVHKSGNTVYKLEQYPTAEVILYVTEGGDRTMIQVQDFVELKEKHPKACKEMGIYTWTGTGEIPFDLKNPDRMNRELSFVIESLPGEFQGWEVFDDARFDAALWFGAQNFQYPDKWVAQLEQEIKKAASNERKATLKLFRKINKEQRQLDKKTRAQVSRMSSEEIERMRNELQGEIEAMETRLKELGELRVRCRSLQTYVGGIRRVVDKRKKR